MIFISAPDANFDAQGNLTNLVGATLWSDARLTFATGTYRVTTYNSVSDPFTTSGSNGVLGETVTGNALRSFLFAPTENFSGDRLTSLTGCLLSKSQNVIGLLGGASYRVMILAEAAPTISVDLSETGEWVVTDTIVEQAPTPAAPAAPSIVGSTLFGTAGRYRIVNPDQGTDAEYDLVPPASLSTWAQPGETVTVERLVFSSVGPTVSFPGIPPAFPTFRSTGVNTVGASSVTSATVTIDATRQVGDTLFVALVADDNPTFSGYSGWTLIREDLNAGGSASHKTLLIKRTATADANDNLTVTFSSAQTWAAKAWCGIGAQEITVTAPASSGSLAQTANCPSLTLSEERYARWLALVSQSGTGSDISAGAAPTNYSYVGTIASSGFGGQFVEIHAASRELIATTEDPGTFAQTIDQPNAYTVAIYNAG